MPTPRPGHYWCEACDEPAYGELCQRCHRPARFVLDDPARRPKGKPEPVAPEPVAPERAAELFAEIHNQLNTTP